jgi:hypothetical protein
MTKVTSLSRYQGPHSSYDEDVFAEIIQLISTSTAGMEEILSQKPYFPVKATFYSWLRACSLEESTRRLNAYSTAVKARASIIESELLPLADEVRRGVIMKQGPKGVEITQADAVERSRLQIETRKWLLARLDPMKYGQQVNIGGMEGNPIKLVVEHVGSMKDDDSKEDGG